jgi:hypothetical protein
MSDCVMPTRMEIIEDLIRRKFFLSQAGAQQHLSIDHLLRQATDAQRREALAYLAELLAKPWQVVMEVYSADQDGDVEEQEAEQGGDGDEEEARTEPEEQEPFLEMPYADADFGFWCKMPFWRLDEGAALLLGKAPDVVTHERVKPYIHVSSFAVEYSRMRELVLRAHQYHELDFLVTPGDFIDWAKRTGIAIPEEFEAAVSARGQVVNWKVRHDEVVAQASERAKRDGAAVERLNDEMEVLARQCTDLVDEIKATKAALDAERTKPTEMNVRVRETLVTMLAVAAMEAYRIDPKKPRNEGVGEFVRDLERYGARRDANTVRAYLAEGFDHLPPREAIA